VSLFVSGGITLGLERSVQVVLLLQGSKLLFLELLADGSLVLRSSLGGSLSSSLSFFLENMLIFKT
jgi:hypothetical protein